MKKLTILTLRDLCDELINLGYEDFHINSGEDMFIGDVFEIDRNLKEIMFYTTL